MASTSTSRSACMVRITTWVPGTRSRTWRVASTPSSTGMVTSMRMTSGWSSSARRTASAPSGASPTTSNPLSSMERRSDSRSIRWSSASRSRTGRSRLSAASLTGSAHLRVLQPAADGRAPPGLGLELQYGADRVGPLPHADHAVGVDPARPTDGEAEAVVGDHEKGVLAVAAPLHVEVGGAGMTFDVADRLLGDTPHLPLLGHRQPHRLLVPE